MYVKIFSQILDSSLADDRKLRHFFMDLLLLSDPDGNVIMTPNAIATRIRAGVEEAEWGLTQLQKPDSGSLSKENEGRRLVPLEGHGYGWRIVNYHTYRDYKTAKEMREASAARVKKWREKKKFETWKKPMSKTLAERVEEKEMDRTPAPVAENPVMVNPATNGKFVVAVNGVAVPQPEFDSTSAPAPEFLEVESALCKVCESCVPENGTVCNDCLARKNA
jgi:hypothetical protein